MKASTATTYAVDVEDLEFLRHADTPLLARLFKPRGTGPQEWLSWLLLRLSPSTQYSSSFSVTAAWR